METRGDEGKLKFRDTEGTLIGKGTEEPDQNANRETISTKFHYVNSLEKLPLDTALKSEGTSKHFLFRTNKIKFFYF